MHHLIPYTKLQRVLLLHCAMTQPKPKRHGILLVKRLMPLHRALFTETSPSPVKYVAAKLGLCDAEIRLPLVPVTPGTERVLDAAIARTGLEPVGPSRIGN